MYKEGDRFARSLLVYHTVISFVKYMETAMKAVPSTCKGEALYTFLFITAISYPAKK